MPFRDGKAALDLHSASDPLREAATEETLNSVNVPCYSTVMPIKCLGQAYRAVTRLAVVLGLAAGSLPVLAQTPAISPGELVRKTVERELQASNETSNLMFRSRKETRSGSQTKVIIQTRDAMAGMLVAVDDKPLKPEQLAAEERRLDNLVNNPQELRRKQKQEKEDSDRADRIVRALPDAFVYEYDGTEPGSAKVGKPGDELVRLKFRPNPKYEPPSRVEQVLTGMQGLVLIDAQQHRIAKIDGTLFKDVSFGWGILGHLDKGGRFQVEQGEVAEDRWDVERMSLSFTGRILLFKGLNIKSEEVYSDYRRVDDDLSFAQGVALLKKTVESANDSRTSGL